MHTDRCGNTWGQEYHTKASRKRITYEMKEAAYRDAMDVEHEAHNCVSDNWGHWNSNKRFKEKFGSHNRKTFNRLTTKDSYT